jgi:hypothetical protein
VGLDIHESRPLRLTGQLFFDASHRPCSGGRRARPARFTSWEIHPVYNIEVCRNRSESRCRLGSDADWMAFDEWLGEDEHRP